MATVQPSPVLPPAPRKRKASTSGPLTRRLRKELRKELPDGDPKSLLAEMHEAENEDDGPDYQPEAPSDVEEEFDEGGIVDDERPPFADGEVTPASDALVAQLHAADPAAALSAAAVGDDDEEDEFRPEAEPEEPAEEFDEGNVVDDERPPFADGEVAPVGDALVAELAAAADADAAADAADADFVPGTAPAEPEEEYDEGAVVDDERPPFKDGELTPASDALVAQLDAAAGSGAHNAAGAANAAVNDEDDDEDDFCPEAEPAEPSEEYDEGDIVDDDRPPFDDEP